MNLTMDERNMLIRHDEQLKAVPRLCESVDRLTEAVQELQVQKRSWWQIIMVLGSVASCVGTWIILVKFGK